MTYENWFENHAKKHQKIVQKCINFSNDAIVEYFRYDNMVQKEVDFCPLYKDNKKCHDIEDLNCYLCGCSNFRLTNIKSYCDIDSKDGFIHQDCSACTIPHKEDFIKLNFNRSWEKMMGSVL